MASECVNRTSVVVPSPAKNPVRKLEARSFIAACVATKDLSLYYIFYLTT